MMKGPELLGVIVRGLGLWQFVIGVTAIAGIFSAPVTSILKLGVHSLTGAVLLVAADEIVRFAYFISRDERNLRATKYDDHDDLQ